MDWIGLDIFYLFLSILSSSSYQRTDDSLLNPKSCSEAADKVNGQTKVLLDHSYHSGEFHNFSTFSRIDGDNVKTKTASCPPAPGTPAANTPGILNVISNNFVCDSGSISTEEQSPINFKVLRPS